MPYDFLRSTPTLSQFVSVFSVLLDLAGSEKFIRSKAGISQIKMLLETEKLLTIGSD